MYIVSQAIDVPNTVHAAVSGKMVYGIATYKIHFHTAVWKSPADKNLKTAMIITNLFMSSYWMSKINPPCQKVNFNDLTLAGPQQKGH